MRIVVCIKQVPNSNQVRFDSETNTIIRDAKFSVINPFDSFAVELAAQIREKREGVEAIALSMGIPATETLLRDAVSCGLDRAVLLSDRIFAGADTLATSYVLSLGISWLGGADLILCGKMSVDGDTAQIGPELAEQLGIPHVTEVQEIISIADDHVLVNRLVDGGQQKLKVKLPALFTLGKDISFPRMPSIKGIRNSMKMSFNCLDHAALDADVTRCGLIGSPTQVLRLFTPERTDKSIILAGPENVQIQALAKLINEVTTCPV